MNSGLTAEEITLREKALTDLITDCPELAQLEAKLAQFNIFRVIRADRSELRHSNMLAWLFDPDGQHGLDDLFLRRWLMTVLGRADRENRRTAGWTTPIAVDVLGIERVEVHRELENIDLLFAIHTDDEKHWIVCVENKIESKQGKDQLATYHRIVEGRFHGAERRIYVFLTKNNEQADHDEFMHCSYEEVLDVLKRCTTEREDSIGTEPSLLIQHYMQLIADDFMEESEVNELARQIYLRHKLAIDVIIDNKGDARFDTTNSLESVLAQNQERLGLVMGRTNKGYIRFLPKEWDVPANTGGKAWGPNSRYLVCEVNLWTKQPQLHMTVAYAPEVWADLVWRRAAAAPFKQETKKRPKSYIKPFKAKSTRSTEKLFELGGEDAANILLDWLEGEFAKSEFKDAVRELTALLDQFPPTETDPGATPGP